LKIIKKLIFQKKKKKKKAPPTQKLPSLYLLDSIIKNVGKDYISLFSEHVFGLFCNVYENAQQKEKESMKRLFKTWEQFFPRQVLQDLEDRFDLGGNGSLPNQNVSF